MSSELAQKGIEIQMKKRCIGVQPSLEDGKLDVLFEDGSREDSVDVVVGADGAKSAVREFVLGEEDGGGAPYFSGWSCVVGVCDPILGLKDEDAGVTQNCLPKGQVLLHQVVLISSTNDFFVTGTIRVLGFARSQAGRK